MAGTARGWKEGADAIRVGNIEGGAGGGGCSVAKLCLNSLQPHGPQHARPPCPSPSPRAFSNSCPLSQ